jgi:hypothetical protein
MTNESHPSLQNKILFISIITAALSLGVMVGGAQATGIPTCEQLEQACEDDNGAPICTTSHLRTGTTTTTAVCEAPSPYSDNFTETCDTNDNQPNMAAACQAQDSPASINSPDRSHAINQKVCTCTATAVP